MANSLSTRQWLLDTPTPFGSPGAILWDSNVFIKQIEFMNYAAQGNICLLMDKNGQTIWLATGASDLSPVRLGDIGWVDGIVLDTLDNANPLPPNAPPGTPPQGSICVIYIK